MTRYERPIVVNGAAVATIAAAAALLDSTPAGLLRFLKKSDYKKKFKGAWVKWAPTGCLMKSPSLKPDPVLAERARLASHRLVYGLTTMRLGHYAGGPE